MMYDGKVLAIIQARMGSTRLPGKIMLPLAGQPVLRRVAERTAAASRVGRVVVATTDAPRDAVVRDFCREMGIDCFAGSENDVLDRYFRAAQAFGGQEWGGIARITADCPLLDPAIIDQVIDLFFTSGADYVSNTKPPTFPHGLDVEVFRFEALAAAHTEAWLPSEREHVTPFIRNQPDRFRQANLANERDLSHIRLTLDQPEDYEVIAAMYEALSKGGRLFGLAEMVDFWMAHPEIAAKNAGFTRNEGYIRSLAADREAMKKAGQKAASEAAARQTAGIFPPSQPE